jgi:hypothetical protein
LGIAGLLNFNSLPLTTNTSTELFGLCNWRSINSAILASMKKPDKRLFACRATWVAGLDLCAHVGLVWCFHGIVRQQNLVLI